MPDELHAPPTTPEDLGRTYAAIAGDAVWHTDVPPSRRPPKSPPPRRPLCASSRPSSSSAVPP